MGCTGFSDVELHWIGQFAKAEKTLPDDFWCVAAMQELACHLARVQPLLTDAQTTTLVGIGALLQRLGRNEFVAEIETSLLFAKLRAHP
jgi:hypothetical protein